MSLYLIFLGKMAKLGGGWQTLFVVVGRLFLERADGMGMLTDC